MSFYAINFLQCLKFSILFSYYVLFLEIKFVSFYIFYISNFHSFAFFCLLKYIDNILKQFFNFCGYYFNHLCHFCLFLFIYFSAAYGSSFFFFSWCASSFKLDIRNLKFYIVECWIVWYSFKYYLSFWEMKLRSLGSAWFFSSFLLSFVRIVYD